MCVTIFVMGRKDMGKKLSDDFVNNRLIVFGMESEQKNQEIKNKIVDTFNKKLEEEEDDRD
jgi:hypothetical protein|tara:strand:+ start:963 stop:1145 length:183 start_codon:yes stop_codon:yes gene_type:complete